MREVRDPRCGMAHRPQSPLDLPARRIAHEEGAPARAAIARHRRQPANIPEIRADRAIDQLERDARQEDPNYDYRSGKTFLFKALGDAGVGA